MKLNGTEAMTKIAQPSSVGGQARTPDSVLADAAARPRPRPANPSPARSGKSQSSAQGTRVGAYSPSGSSGANAASGSQQAQEVGAGGEWQQGVSAIRVDGSVKESSEKVVDEALEKANRILSGSNRKFEVTFHEKTNEVMVRVIDTITNETVREVPPKKIVDIVVSLCELAGIIFDEKG